MSRRFCETWEARELKFADSHVSQPRRDMGHPIVFLTFLGKVFSSHDPLLFRPYVEVIEPRQPEWMGNSRTRGAQVSLVRRTEHNKQREALDYDCATLVFAPNFPS